MHIQNAPLITLYILSLLLLTGCWDSVELEERAFIYGVAVDLANDSTKNDYQLRLTDQLVVPSGINTTSEGVTNQKAYRNLSKSGDNLFDINNKISKQENRTMFAEHLEVIIFSEEVVMQPDLFKKSLDVFTRTQDMRRGIKVAISKGKANALLEIVPEDVKLPSEYISTLLENQRSAEVSYPLRLGDLNEYLLMELSFVMPYLYILDDESIENDGVAVFNGKKGGIVGILNGTLTKGRNIITGDANSGTISISADDTKFTAELIDNKSKINLVNEKKNNLKFQLEVEVTGIISETADKNNPFTNSEAYEEELVKKISSLIKQTIEKAQNELQTDIFKINVYLRNHHYTLWESIKENWDTGENYFRQSDISVDVDVTIEHSGNTLYNSEKEGG
ncbi:Ger(x)C family spore germination protein [Paraliobacillus salinarum]|uniref:Ger(x)C family spore germination protein n=1 Tax=Paraliobacillus salinarum TaxID=1158996 RepID=UPI0015F5C7AF|nr:Ger(x)C family spore germination protein [Paraliobacillus salinarum]